MEPKASKITRPKIASEMVGTESTTCNAKVHFLSKPRVFPSQIALFIPGMCPVLFYSYTLGNYLSLHSYPSFSHYTALGRRPFACLLSIAEIK